MLSSQPVPHLLVFLIEVLSPPVASNGPDPSPRRVRVHTRVMTRRVQWLLLEVGLELMLSDGLVVLEIDVERKRGFTSRGEVDRWGAVEDGRAGPGRRSKAAADEISVFVCQSQGKGACEEDGRRESWKRRGETYRLMMSASLPNWKKFLATRRRVSKISSSFPLPEHGVKRTTSRVMMHRTVTPRSIRLNVDV